jgi:hypothetical protein
LPCIRHHLWDHKETERMRERVGVGEETGRMRERGDRENEGERDLKRIPMDRWRERKRERVRKK